MFHLLTRTVKDRAWEGGSELPLLERQREYQLREEMSSGAARLEKMRWGRGKRGFIAMEKAFELEYELSKSSTKKPLWSTERLC